MVEENINKYLFEKSYSLSFYNPYDEDEKSTKKEPSNIYDAGCKLEKQKEAFLTPATEVVRVKNGYIVKAKENFRKGDIIERAPIILQPSHILKFQILKDIVYELDKENGIYGLVLGNGSLYSHSDNPNIDFAWDKSKSIMVFIARRKIKKGENLTINYGFEYWNDRMPKNLRHTMDNSLKQMKENIIDPTAMTPGPLPQNISSSNLDPSQSGLPILTGTI